MASLSTDAGAARSVAWAHAVQLKPALAACVLISLAAHVGLVALSRGGSVRLGDDSHLERAATTMHVRMVAMPAATAPTAQIETAPTAAAGVTESQPPLPGSENTRAAEPLPTSPRAVATMSKERPAEAPSEATRTPGATTTTSV